MKNGLAQVKDIDDLPVLQFLKLIADRKIVQVYNSRTGLEAYASHSACSFPGFANSILNAMSYGDRFPNKLRLAKVRSMIRRGLVSGCCCGCRGDFEITTKGLEALAGREVVVG